MRREVRVKVVKRGRDGRCVLRWTDPVTRRLREKDAGTSSRNEATRRAGQLEAELRDGRYAVGPRVKWSEFRIRFEAEKFRELSAAGQQRYQSSLNVFEREMNPATLGVITTPYVSTWKGRLYDRGISEATVACHLRHLKAALRWAKKQGIVNDVPDFEMPRKSRGRKVMKGRPISDEEFGRLLSAVEEVVGSAEAESWSFFLRGLWSSGLRLGEALQLHWERFDLLHILELDGQRPLLVIPGLQKSGKFGTYPLAPEFVQLLRSVPGERRQGFVFAINQACLENVSKIGSRIGRLAKVSVGVNSTTGKEKFASIHDLRRSFGQRWAMRVPSFVLKELMRHENVATTEKFYVGQAAERTADVVWQAFGRETALALGERSGDNLAERQAAPLSEQRETLTC